MAMGNPLRNPTKMMKMALFLEPMLQLWGRNGTIMTPTLKGEGDANIGSSEYVRKLCKQDRLEEALHILHVMDQSIDYSTYICLLQGCIKKKAWSEGKLVHAHMTNSGFMVDRFLQNTLVNMYAKCGSLLNARRVFDQVPEQDVFSWTVMIAAYARQEHAREALILFYQMQRTHIQPNQFTFPSVLPACASLAALELGMEIHEEIIRNGYQSDVVVANALVHMYAKCGSLENARHVFDKMVERNVVSWTAMIAGYAQNGYVDEALKLFRKMPERNVVSWTAMIAGYAQNGQSEEALKFFRQMQLAGVKPNSKTFASVIPACANLSALEQGMEIHGEICKTGFQCDVFVAIALVDMYSKCGRIETARNVFDKIHQRDVVSWNAMIAGYAQNGHVDEALKLFEEMPEPDVVSWTVMIAGYAQNGYNEEALKLFRQMQQAGVIADSKAFVSVLQACANLAAMELGMEIHEEITRSGLQSNVSIANALANMYAKCGNLNNSHNVFDKIHHRDVASWNVMIAGYAMHGCGKEALKLFEQMQDYGMIPNHVTLLCVLSACCHAGLVNEGQQYFDCISQYYHITPAMEHYGRMVDLLGRAGRLDEAVDFINKMPIKPDATVWRCLLGACRLHGNTQLGESVAQCLFELDPKNAAPYVLLSNIYAAAGRWDDITKVRKMMKDQRVKKPPGCSWIEVNKQVHVFLVGGTPPNANQLCEVGEII
eukprot:Gb_27462 [translate_table: standard]